MREEERKGDKRREEKRRREKRRELRGEMMSRIEGVKNNRNE